MEASRLRRRVRQRRIEASPRLRRQAMELRGLPGASCHRRAAPALPSRSCDIEDGGACLCAAVGRARRASRARAPNKPSQATLRGSVATSLGLRRSRHGRVCEALHARPCCEASCKHRQALADKAPRPVDGYRGPRPLQRRCARAAPGNIRAGRPSIADGPSARCQPPRKRCCGLSPALSGVCAEAYVPRACKLRVRAHPAPASWPLCRANLNQLGRRDFRRPATASSTRAIPMPNVQCGVAATASGPLNTHASSHIFLVDKECPQVKCGTRVRR